MEWISQSELADIQREAVNALPDRATVLRRTFSADGNGGKVDAYVAQDATVRCRIVFQAFRPVVPDMQTGGQVKPSETFLVTLPHDADVLETDRLSIKGTLYAIVSNMAARSYEVTKRLLVRRI
jgi:hypothetical protein